MTKNTINNEATAAYPDAPSLNRTINDEVTRVGCWFNGARYCRSAIRSGSNPAVRSNSFGFRLCCSARDVIRIGQTLKISSQPQSSSMTIDFELPSDIKFCGGCGYDLKNHRDSRTCPKCGTPLVPTETEPAEVKKFRIS